MTFGGNKRTFSGQGAYNTDQFVFKRTGSTTAALIYLFHHLTYSLQNHKSVYLVALDFSEAFDTVRCSTLAAKIVEFPGCDNVYNQLETGNQFLARSPKKQLMAVFLNFSASMLSFVQGSVIGSVAYLLNAFLSTSVRPEQRNIQICSRRYLSSHCSWHTINYGVATHFWLGSEQPAIT